MRVRETPVVSIPFLGDYRPTGWRRVGEPWFCDSSGFGGPGEPALSYKQFALKLADLPEGHGVGTVEAGQFQVYVQEFAPVKARVKEAA